MRPAGRRAEPPPPAGQMTEQPHMWRPCPSGSPKCGLAPLPLPWLLLPDLPVMPSRPHLPDDHTQNCREVTISARQLWRQFFGDRHAANACHLRRSNTYRTESPRSEGRGFPFVGPGVLSTGDARAQLRGPALRCPLRSPPARCGGEQVARGGSAAQLGSCLPPRHPVHHAWRRYRCPHRPRAGPAPDGVPGDDVDGGETSWPATTLLKPGRQYR